MTRRFLYHYNTYTQGLNQSNSFDLHNLNLNFSFGTDEEINGETSKTAVEKESNKDGSSNENNNKDVKTAFSDMLATKAKEAINTFSPTTQNTASEATDSKTNDESLVATVPLHVTEKRWGKLIS